MHSGWVPLQVRSAWHSRVVEPWSKCPGWHWKATMLPTCSMKATSHTLWAEIIKIHLSKRSFERSTLRYFSWIYMCSYVTHFYLDYHFWTMIPPAIIFLWFWRISRFVLVNTIYISSAYLIWCQLLQVHSNGKWFQLQYYQLSDKSIS